MHIGCSILLIQFDSTVTIVETYQVQIYRHFVQHGDIVNMSKLALVTKSEQNSSLQLS